VRAALTGDRLRKYPDPVGTTSARSPARVLDIDPDGILIGNGSDDVLTISTRAFVRPAAPCCRSTPSYLLYRTLAEIQGARFVTVPFADGWGLPDRVPPANVFYLANPNSPSAPPSVRPTSRRWRRGRGPLVVDEAYADFAEDNALGLARAGKVIVTRTLSQVLRAGRHPLRLRVAPPAVVRELVKVKDSYNCDALSLAAAAAALDDQEYLRDTRAKVLTTRARLARGLAALGFRVTPSQSNFVWAKRDDRPVRPIFEELKRRGIFVRYMNYEGHGDGLRVSVGTDAEIDRCWTR